MRSKFTAAIIEPRTDIKKSFFYAHHTIQTILFMLIFHHFYQQPRRWKITPRILMFVFHVPEFVPFKLNGKLNLASHIKGSLPRCFFSFFETLPSVSNVFLIYCTFSIRFKHIRAVVFTIFASESSAPFPQQLTPICICKLGNQIHP